jgi:hypothetical protein
VKVYILAKNHRPREAWCKACDNTKKRTAKFLIDDEKGGLTPLHICSGCLAAAHEVAVRGRKVERE